MGLAVPAAAWFSNHPLVDRWLSGSTRDLAIAAAVFLISLNLAAVGGLVLASGLGVLRPWHDTRGRWAAVLVLVPPQRRDSRPGVFLRAGGRAVRALGDAWVRPRSVSLALFVTIVQLFRRSQQWEALSADEALRRDARAPVVYLRAFTDDGQMAVRGHHWQDRVIGKAASALTLTSPEQELAFILQRVGPVIAIGKPGERLPELGAARAVRVTRVVAANGSRHAAAFVAGARARGCIAGRAVGTRSGAVARAAIEGADPDARDRRRTRPPAFARSSRASASRCGWRRRRLPVFAGC